MAVLLMHFRTRMTLALGTLASTAFILAALIAGGFASTERASAQVPDADFTVHAKAQRHGIQLTYDFELSSLPADWRVRAVEIHRQSEHGAPEYGLVDRDEIEESLHRSTSFTNRTYLDYLTTPHVNIRSRDSRSLFLYKFRVVFDNGTDGHEFVGNFAGHTRYRVPVVPTPPGYSVILYPPAVKIPNHPFRVDYVAVWRTPHLSWSANFNLGSVAAYLFYIDGNLSSTRTPEQSQWKIPNPVGVGDHRTFILTRPPGADLRNNTFALRVSFGAFYSSLVTVHWWCGSYLPAPC